MWRLLKMGWPFAYASWKTPGHRPQLFSRPLFVFVWVRNPPEMVKQPKSVPLGHSLQLGGGPFVRDIMNRQTPLHFLPFWSVVRSFISPLTHHQDCFPEARICSSVETTFAPCVSVNYALEKARADLLPRLRTGVLCLHPTVHLKANQRTPFGSTHCLPYA